MGIPEDIAEARAYLEQAERESNPERKVEKLKEGIDLLDLYVEENPDAPKDTLTYITNLRRSHTRRLLAQLLSLKHIDIETWIQYFMLLVTRLKDEIDYETSQDPGLKRNYDEFWDQPGDDGRKYSDVLLGALEKRLNREKLISN